MKCLYCFGVSRTGFITRDTLRSVSEELLSASAQKPSIFSAEKIRTREDTVQGVRVSLTAPATK
jgi:hypothetical protein